MALYQALDLARTTVASAYTSGGPTITVADGSVFGSFGNGRPVSVTFYSGQSPSTGTVYTKLKITGRSGNVLTVGGPMAGYSASNIPSGAKAAAFVDAPVLNELSDAVAAGVSIGDSIGSGLANSVLYVDASGDLADSANLTFDGSKLAIRNQVVVTMSNAQSAAPWTIKNNSNVSVFSILATGQISSPTDGVGAQFGRYEFNGPTYPGLLSCLSNNFVVYAPSTFKVMLESAGGNIEFGSFNSPKIVSWGKHAFGGTTANAQVHVTPTGAGVTGQIVQAQTGQTAPLVSVQAYDGTPLTEIDNAGNGFVHKVGFVLGSGVDLTTGTSLISPSVPAPFAGKIVKWKAIAGTNGSSGGFSFDLKKNGSSIFDSPVSVSSSTTTLQSGSTFATTTVAEGDLFNVDVTAAGSGVQNVRIELYLLTRNK